MLVLTCCNFGFGGYKRGLEQRSCAAAEKSRGGVTTSSEI